MIGLKAKANRANSRWSAILIFGAAALIVSATANLTALEIRVSPNGPIASLEAARDRIREARTAGDKSAVTVEVEEGLYFLTQPFVLEPQDSGTPATPVIYRARNADRPVFSGGKMIGNWRKGAEGLLSAPTDTHSLKPFRQLFLDGRRLTRARTPNEGYFNIAGRVEPDKANTRNNRGFVFRENDLYNWSNLESVEVIAIHSWETSRLRIKSVDLNAKSVEFTGPAHWPFTQWDESQRYYVENAPDSLDQSGEWLWNETDKVVQYAARAGEIQRESQFIAPQLKQLVLFVGDPSQNKFVTDVIFEGLSFQHADWELPPTGYSDAQAAHTIPGAIELAGAKRCVMRDCEIAHVGGYALRVKGGSKDITLTQNHFHDLGAGGIGIGETTIPKSTAEATGRVVVSDNRIRNGGHVYESGEGVWIGQSSDNTISHNEIADFGYTGVSIGWTWGYDESAAQRNVVEFNHIHHIGNDILSDMGAIYTLGFSAGTILRNNHIHHIYSYHYGGWGIYPDEGTSHMLIENNVVHHTKTGGFHQHYGKENFVQNNIFAFSKNEQVIRSRVEEHRSFRFERNIVYFDGGDLLGSNWSGDHFYMDRNIYWRTDEGVIDFQGMTLDEWRAAKDMDWNSRVADPKFKNPAHPEEENFEMSPNSPAFELGFQPIDLDEIGPRRVSKRRTLDDDPEEHRQPESLWAGPPDPTNLDESFENVGIDQGMPLGVSNGQTGGATIGVTEETAADGKRSLKFTDAPGLNREFNPHWYMDLGYRSGTARASFDLLFESGESVYHEWRTEGSPYHAGPTITIRGDGTLIIGGEERGKLPADTWIHFEIETGLGKKANGTYHVSVQVEGEDARHYENIPCDKNFRSLRWFGFCSMATEKKAFYLDNLRTESR